MVNMRSLSSMPESTNISGDVYALAETHASMDELCRHNQTLKDDIHNIIERQHESNPLEDMELLDP